MIKTLWEKVIKFIFRGSTQSKNDDYTSNDKYAADYEDIKGINYTAIFSNKLAKYVVTQSKITLDGDNARTKLLNEVVDDVWTKMKKITARTFGTGGTIIAPYVKNGKLLYDIVSQNRLSINQKLGEKITECTILADVKNINNFIDAKQYYRWSNYKIENNKCVITQKFTDEHGNEISKPECWKDIKEQFVITNCDKVLVSFLKSPIDNRKMSDLYGVPITYGCESTIAEINECLNQIIREYELKKTFVGADSTLFDKNEKLVKKGLYKKFKASKDDFWQIFDPAIRDSSYFARLEELYSRLEKEIGTSRGILTEPNTQNATATEIRKALYDTFVIVDDMRLNIEKAMNDFIDICNILANAFKLSPSGEYKVNYDWDYSLLENSQETFNQLQSGLSHGVTRKTELRQFLFPSETIEEAEKAIAEIKENDPNVEDLLGK